MTPGTGAAADPGPAPQSHADYEQRMEELFAPIKREVQRLRTALDDARSLSEDDQ